MKTTYLLYISLTFSFVALAQAKPLSYVGGTMVMQENDETGHTLSVDYTFDPHFALGIYAKYELGGDDFWMAGPQFNTLIKRWNLPDGQGNIFNMTGAGMARKGSRNEPAALMGRESIPALKSGHARFEVIPADIADGATP